MSALASRPEGAGWPKAGAGVALRRLPLSRSFSCSNCFGVMPTRARLTERLGFAICDSGDETFQIAGCKSRFENQNSKIKDHLHGLSARTLENSVYSLTQAAADGNV